MIGNDMLLSKETNHRDRRQNHGIKKLAPQGQGQGQGWQAIGKVRRMESHHEQLACRAHR